MKSLHLQRTKIRKRRRVNLKFCFADFVYLIQELCCNCFIFIPKYARIIMPSARFPNQIHEIRATKLQIYPFALVISTQLLLKATFRLEKAGVCPTGFEATFAATFALFYCLREFVLSLVTNSFLN